MYFYEEKIDNSKMGKCDGREYGGNSKERRCCMIRRCREFKEDNY
jgi:hypothetical protein